MGISFNNPTKGVFVRWSVVWAVIAAVFFAVFIFIQASVKPKDLEERLLYAASTAIDCSFAEDPKWRAEAEAAHEIPSEEECKYAQMRYDRVMAEEERYEDKLNLARSATTFSIAMIVGSWLLLGFVTLLRWIWRGGKASTD